MVIFDNRPLKYLYSIAQFGLATFKVTESHAANDCLTRLSNDPLLTKNTAAFCIFLRTGL